MFPIWAKSDHKHQIWKLSTRFQKFGRRLGISEVDLRHCSYNAIGYLCSKFGRNLTINIKFGNFPRVSKNSDAILLLILQCYRLPMFPIWAKSDHKHQIWKLSTRFQKFGRHLGISKASLRHCSYNAIGYLCSKFGRNRTINIKFGNFLRVSKIWDAILEFPKWTLGTVLTML